MTERETDVRREAVALAEGLRIHEWDWKGRAQRAVVGERTANIAFHFRAEDREAVEKVVALANRALSSPSEPSPAEVRIGSFWPEKHQGCDIDEPHGHDADSEFGRVAEPWIVERMQRRAPSEPSPAEGLRAGEGVTWHRCRCSENCGQPQPGPGFAAAMTTPSPAQEAGDALVPVWIDADPPDERGKHCFDCGQFYPDHFTICPWSDRPSGDLDALRATIEARLADADMESHTRYLSPGLRAALDAAVDAMESKVNADHGDDWSVADADRYAQDREATDRHIAALRALNALATRLEHDSGGEG